MLAIVSNTSIFIITNEIFDPKAIREKQRQARQAVSKEPVICEVRHVCCIPPTR